MLGLILQGFTIDIPPNPLSRVRRRTLKLRKEERKGIRERWLHRKVHSIPDPTGSNSVLGVS
jgi:hypothetical protein